MKSIVAALLVMAAFLLIVRLRKKGRRKLSVPVTVSMVSAFHRIRSA